MIKINDIQYSNYQIEVLWKNFNVTHKNGEKMSGKAPYITFSLKENLLVGLEFIFSEEMFLNTKINVKTNIKEYISDIIFENEEGCTSLINENYDCNITRINEKNFHFNFYVESKINIFINVNIDLF